MIQYDSLTLTNTIGHFVQPDISEGIGLMCSQDKYIAKSGVASNGLCKATIMIRTDSSTICLVVCCQPVSGMDERFILFHASGSGQNVLLLGMVPCQCGLE
uniref:Uncharacterized protein n=1 Tax=Eutreptiella gymnastica TaxID=73025 RepID=A0A7S1NUN4_9EUGL|mmetsp:Transcript_90736/g.157326  ORF Transcript_90736/g.157326 Transcript_90736/m.157326 type:complete len:101 (+) Transcript_90736:663-965(+)